MNTKGFWYKDTSVLVFRPEGKINFTVSIIKGLYRWTFENVEGIKLEKVLEILAESDIRPDTIWKECLFLFTDKVLVHYAS